MARPKPADPQAHITINLPQSVLDAIDDVWHQDRYPSRSAAVVGLLRSQIAQRTVLQQEIARRRAQERAEWPWLSEMETK